MITDTFTINVHTRVVMYMYSIFSYDWKMATKACKFASVRCSLNLELFQRIKVWHASMLTVAPTGATDMFVNWCARHGRKSKVL